LKFENRYRNIHLNKRKANTIGNVCGTEGPGGEQQLFPGSADWFWERWTNSYALQVEPARYMTADEAILQSEEALRKLVGRELSAQRVS